MLSLDSDRIERHKRPLDSLVYKSLDQISGDRTAPHLDLVMPQIKILKSSL